MLFRSEMKQIVLMSAFSALMLMFTGCSEDKIIDDNPGGGLNSDQISLNVYTENNTTRATDAVIGSNFTNFQVYAMNGTTSLLAPNTTYTYSSANSKWAFSGTAPNWTDASFQTFPIRFFALANNASTNTLYNVTTTPALTYSYTSPASANQVDLLAAITTIQRKPVGGTVPFPFKHALSKVKMRVEVGAGVKLILKSLTLKNLKNSATLTFNAA